MIRKLVLITKVTADRDKLNLPNIIRFKQTISENQIVNADSLDCIQTTNYGFL